MEYTYITKDKKRLQIAEYFTDSTLTAVTTDGKVGFCGGDGELFCTVKVIIPGYSFVYGIATASPEHDDAWAALAANGYNSFPRGSKICFFDRIR